MVTVDLNLTLDFFVPWNVLESSGIATNSRLEPAFALMHLLESGFQALGML